MKYLMTMLLACATLEGVGQANFVRNPSFEIYDTCPYEADQITYCTNWCNIIDTIFKAKGLQSEYYNECAIGNISTNIPENGNFYQFAHSGSGMVGGCFYYDKSASPTPPVPDYREYINAKLYSKLLLGKTYCVSFFINLMEASGYAHNKIGAYFDDGEINKLSIPIGKEIITLKPQVYSDVIIKDTMNWVKIEGSFTATGMENYVTIGNFFPNDSVSAVVTNYWFTFPQYSYYLIDDVSVVPIDAKANAGADRWVELGKTIQIGPVEDSTARGMDCKWYYKGKLIDSGNLVRVASSGIKYAIDTYLVVQNVCGNITRDTMLLQTVGLGMKSTSLSKIVGFNVYPNPSNGNLTITPHGFIPTKEISQYGKVYDLPGRIVYEFCFINETTIDMNLSDGIYILEIKDTNGNAYRQKIEVRK